MNLESNVYERVNEIVDELRFRSFDKVYATHTHTLGFPQASPAISPHK